MGFLTLILLTTLRSYYYPRPHFTDEKNEAERVKKPHQGYNSILLEWIQRLSLNHIVCTYGKTSSACVIFILNNPEFELLMPTCKEELCKFLVKGLLIL